MKVGECVKEEIMAKAAEKRQHKAVPGSSLVPSRRPATTGGVAGRYGYETTPEALSYSFDQSEPCNLVASITKIKPRPEGLGGVRGQLNPTFTIHTNDP